MGTRADFYVGQGEGAEWLGSIAWDGYPEGIELHLEEQKEFFGTIRNKIGEWPKGEHLFDAKTEEEYRERVERFFQYRTDVTRPEDGWPWPWEDSCTTDYSYALIDDKVMASCFGHKWFNPQNEEENYDEDGGKEIFPFMGNGGDKAPLGSERSGVMVFGIKK